MPIDRRCDIWLQRIQALRPQQPEHDPGGSTAEQVLTDEEMDKSGSTSAVTEYLANFLHLIR